MNINTNITNYNELSYNASYSNKMKFKGNYKEIVLTGIHIGGNVDSYGIGGVDAPVIKNPLNNEPIIPGSSIKGKMKMLLCATDNEELNFNNIVVKDI